jgi:alpha-glucosidase
LYGPTATLESGAVSTSPRDRWWEGAVIYQVYPRSFADANGDGIGDLAGITSRLDHLRGTDASLDVDALWLSPIYPSPLHDFGYDISDYTGVAPEYGGLADLDALIDACHARGLRILMDLVPCHTSIEHPWFVESRSSRNNPKRDWYLWADPAPDGGPPTNWDAVFGGSSWQLDPTTGQFYLHTFYPEQPDLNWRNPAVADAIAGVMRIWFERGIDGFRVDAIFAAVKDDRLRDNPPDRRPHHIPGLGVAEGVKDPLWSMNRPEVHDVVRGLRGVADEYPGRVLVGETYLPVEEMVRYLGDGRDDEFHLAFDFEPLLSPWEVRHLALAIERAEALHPPGAWPTYAFSNHDQSRQATRWGDERARAAAFLLLTLRGVAVLYAGEEIGMVDADRATLPQPPFDRAGRDGVRTPMQWDASTGGGFTTGTPWLPLVDPKHRNVAAQIDDEGSLLALYRRLIAARRAHPALGRGSHRSIFGVAPDVLAWIRESDGERVLVVLNVGADRRTCQFERLAATHGDVLVATGRRAGDIALTGLVLEPLEGLALRI